MFSNSVCILRGDVAHNHDPQSRESSHFNTKWGLSRLFSTSGKVSPEGALWQPGPEISGHLFLLVMIQKTFNVSSIKSWNSSLVLIGSWKEAALFFCKCFNGPLSKMDPAFYFSFATATATGTFSLSRSVHWTKGKCLSYESVWKTQNFRSTLALNWWAYNLQEKLP